MKYCCEHGVNVEYYKSRQDMLDAGKRNGSIKMITYTVGDYGELYHYSTEQWFGSTVIVTDCAHNYRKAPDEPFRFPIKKRVTPRRKR